MLEQNGEDIPENNEPANNPIPQTTTTQDQSESEPANNPGQDKESNSTSRNHDSSQTPAAPPLVTDQAGPTPSDQPATNPNPSSTETPPGSNPTSNEPAPNVDGQSATTNTTGPNNPTQPSVEPAGSNITTSNTQPVNQQNITANQTPARNKNLTILNSTDVQIEVTKIQQDENKGKTNWAQYQAYWKSLTNLIQFRADSMQTVDPQSPDFHFKQVPCSYNAWIKTISSVGRLSLYSLQLFHIHY